MRFSKSSIFLKLFLSLFYILDYVDPNLIIENILEKTLIYFNNIFYFITRYHLRIFLKIFFPKLACLCVCFLFIVCQCLFHWILNFTKVVSISITLRWPSLLHQPPKWRTVFKFTIGLFIILVLNEKPIKQIEIYTNRETMWLSHIFCDDLGTRNLYGYIEFAGPINSIFGK